MPGKLIRSLSVMTALALSVPAYANDIEALPASILFVTSSGYWEEPPEDENGDGSNGEAQLRRGYYKVSAERQADGTARIYLQQMELTPEGPILVETVELEEFTSVKAYVTDIRPENSTGLTAQPGLFVSVYLKTDPAAQQPETWTILIDELGDMRVEKASN